jgi:hypothetical protein
VKSRDAQSRSETPGGHGGKSASLVVEDRYPILSVLHYRILYDFHTNFNRLKMPDSLWNTSYVSAVEQKFLAHDDFISKALNYSTDLSFKMDSRDPAGPEENSR